MIDVELQPDFDNEVPPALLPYQQRWIKDDSPLKVGEKSRRIGLTWAEAADVSLIAASDKKEGGQNCYYIGYNQDMSFEFIQACAMWSRVYNLAAAEIEEGIWEDDQADKNIKTYVINFPNSRNRIVALSSRPANLRGKQGVIVIDEAAFHDQLEELLKAAMAMLIWGGKVRVISTHNGEDNPFNELLSEIRAGKREGSTFHCDFKTAVKDGLYERVCLRLGIEYNKEEEQKWVDDVYKFYGEDAEEELDVIPKSGSGTYLSRTLIEGVMEVDVPVIELHLKDEFTYLPKAQREAQIDDWLKENIKPLLDGLDKNLKHYFGSDFARSGDAASFWPLQEQRNLEFKTPFLLEMRNVPFEQQKQVAFYIVRGLPMFMSGAMDARGNGQYLAEVCQQEFGSTRVEAVMLSQSWYREHMPRFKAHFEDKTRSIPKNANVLTDLRMVKKDKGIAKVPDDARAKGSDGLPRHGDHAIALALCDYAVAEMDAAPIEFEAVDDKTSRWGFDEDDNEMKMYPDTSDDYEDNSFKGGAW